MWIEADQAYAYVQVQNPGPSLLTALRQSEAELKHAVQDILDAQQQLRRAIAIEDPLARASPANHDQVEILASAW